MILSNNSEHVAAFIVYFQKLFNVQNERKDMLNNFMITEYSCLGYA